MSFWQPSLDDPRLLTSRHIVFNLSRPEKSLMLLAPLAKEAGGWGLCQTSPHGVPASAGSALTSTERQNSPDGSPAKVGTPNAAIFASTTDPGYQAIRAMIVAGQEFLDRNKRFDMTGFVPRTDWFREMKRYGMVPQCVKPEEVTDVYAIEQDYWRSLWHQPEPAATAKASRNSTP